MRGPFLEKESNMITAIVRFPLPEGLTQNDARAMFEGAAPKYQNLPGLTRKYFLFGEDGKGGGVYLWESREAADQLYSEEWKTMIEDKFGRAPEIIFYETPVVVDNLIGEVITAAA